MKMNKLTRVVLLVVLITFSLSFLTYYTYDGMSDDSYQLVFNDKYNIYALNIPEGLDFAGERVPIDDPEIQERFDRELLVNTYWQSQTMLFFKRANREFEIIEPILKKHGVPEDFKYLALIESGLVNVVSPAGATGYWQILEGTGRDFGLEISKEVDERYHTEKATEAACRYLKEAHDEFGSWTLAAASYNLGVEGVKNQLERQGGNSYYDLTLNTETGRYVFRILAVKEIMENPEKYGFNFREKDLYQVVPTRDVVVDSSIDDFAKFARQYDINYRILKYHNPWLRYEYLPNNSGKEYVIKIPKKGHYQLSPSAGAETSPDPKPEEDIPAISDTTGSVDDTIQKS